MTPATGWRRRLRLLVGTVIATGLLLACGGGDDKLQSSAAATDGRARALSVASPIDLSVVSLTKISEKRISRTVFDYVFRVTVHNNSEALVAVAATLTAAGQGTTIIDGEVLVGAMAAGATVTPDDTVTLRHDRASPFNPTALVWRLRGNLAVPTVVPGATLFNLPAGRAAIGSRYQATLLLAPVDPNNSIVSLQVDNLTPGGASAAVSLQGLLSWTPNEADFATTTLRISAGLQDGSSSVFDVPVRVTKYRLIAQVPLNGAGRYSDPEGRYLVDVSAAFSGASVTGTLSIGEQYQISGAFSGVITSSDSSHVIRVISSPMGVPFGPAGAGAISAGRQRALSVTAGRTRALSDSSMFTTYKRTIQGSLVDTGYNVYTTRQKVNNKDVEFDQVEVARVEANCSLDDKDACNTDKLNSATPVILIHGYLPEALGLNGGSDTWGSLGSKLDSLGHPVFELRWRTLMRFEEAAGLLVTLARQVSDATGRKPFVIAHSFGGVVAHLALAGEAIAWNDGKWERVPAGSGQDPLFDGLVTLASPLSGINDDGGRTDFVQGRYSGDRSIFFCGEVTCAQAGAFGMAQLNSLQRNVALVKGTSGVRPGTGSSSDLDPGESIDRVRRAWVNDAIALPVKKIHTVIALRERPFDDYTPDLNGSNAYLLGDGLISMIGQSVLPSDFTCNGAITRPGDYNFPGCLDPVVSNFLQRIDDGFVENATTTFVLAQRGGRKYYFASRAAHSSLQVGIGNLLGLGIARYETRPYPIASYQDQVVVGEDWLGRDFKASHPLRFFIDNVLKRSNATPAPRPVVTATVKGAVSVDGISLDLRSVPAWWSIVRVDGGSPVGQKKAIALDAAGNFTFEAAAWLRAQLGRDAVLSDYRIRAEFGDGIVVTTNMLATDRLSDSTATYDLGAIRLTLVVGQAPLVNITGSVTAGVSAQPIAAASVRLVRGVNLAADDLRVWPDSNVARQVATDANGSFSVAGLRSGDYTLLVSRSGFADVLLGRVSVAAGQVIQVVMWPGTGTSGLNDTGIDASQCYAAGSNILVSCSSAAALALNDQQDGMVGRDVTNNDNSDGKAGFSFSLVPRSGGGTYDKTECVRDKVTGLVWEGKTATGARAGSDRYTNWGDGRAGDASAYAAYVNGIALCGFTNWRLPDRRELQGIVDYGVAYPGPTIDAGWFPNTPYWAYWSSSPYVGSADYAWNVNFYDGSVYAVNRYYNNPIRLVR